MKFKSLNTTNKTVKKVTKQNKDEIYLNQTVWARRGAYTQDCFKDDGLDFTNLTISKTKRCNLGKGCENELMFQFVGQADLNHWYPAKHFEG